jgi:hypothetical protein
MMKQLLDQILRLKFFIKKINVFFGKSHFLKDLMGLKIKKVCQQDAKCVFG